VGCHEQRVRAPLNGKHGAPLAAQRPAQQIRPVAGVPDVYDFHRDIQPILDKLCLKCHNYDKREGGVILSGDHGPIYSHSFYTLTYLREFADGRDMLGGNMPPRSLGTSNSPLMWKLGLPGEERHYGVQASAHEIEMVRYWIESGAPYIGTYGALGTGMIGGYPFSQIDKSDRDWPVSVAAAEAIERRCAACHDDSLPLPRYLSDNFNITPSQLDLDNDPRARFSRHRLFNVSRPEKSLVLLAPLAREAGGYNLCQPRGKKSSGASLPVFRDTADPYYGKILALCREGKDHLARAGRFNLGGFRPRYEYVRELRRYGILPADTPDDAQFNTYAADRAYWRSLWYQPRAD
jgi:hypothetical protein